MSLDVVGPAEVFASAGGYEVEVVAPDPEPFVMSNGMTVVPAMTLQQLHVQRPEVARKVEAMSAVDTGAVLAGSD